MTSELSSISDVVNAIKCLNGGNPETRHSANTLLLSFAENEVSWIWCLQLLHEYQHDGHQEQQDQFIRYFCANILLHKVKRHWSQLQSCKQSDVLNFLRNLIQMCSMSCLINTPNEQFMRVFINRVGMVYAIACCQSQDPSSGLAAFADTAMSLISEEPDERSLCRTIGLDLLAVLPGEVEELDISRPHRVELNSTLKQMLIRMIENMEVLITSGSLTHPEVTALLRTLRSWCSQGLSLSTVASEHPTVLHFVVDCLSSNDTQCMRESTGLICDMVLIGEYPRPTIRDQTIRWLITGIVGIQQPNSGLAQLINDPDVDEDALNEICSSISLLAEKEVSYIVSTEGYVPEFIELMLTLASVRPCKIALHTFDFWLALEDVAPSDRSPYMDEEVFRRLVMCLVSQMRYEEEVICSCDEEDEYSIAEFRESQGTQDALQMCVNTLGSQTFFTLLSSLLYPHLVRTMRSHQGNELSSLSLSQHPPTWGSLESSFCTLVLVMEDVRKSWESLIRNGNAATLVSVILVKECVQYIIFCSVNEQLPPVVLCTSCRLIGASTFLLTSENLSAGDIDLRNKCCGLLGTDSGPTSISSLLWEMSELYGPAMSFLFAVLRMPQSTPVVRCSAAKSILQLCTHGTERLVKDVDVSDNMSPNPLLQSVVLRTAELLQKPPTASCTFLMTLLQAVCPVVSKTSPTVATYLLGTIGQPIVSLLQEQLTPEWSAVRVVELLRLAAQVVRYSQSSGDGPSCLVEFLSTMWPHLDQIGGVCAADDTARHVAVAVLDELFALYEHSLVALPEVFCDMNKGLVQNIASRCVAGFVDRRLASGIRCCRVIVETLCTTPTEEREEYISQMLVHVISLLTNSVTALEASQSHGQVVEWEWACEPDAIEMLFMYFYQHFVSCPNLILRTCASTPEVKTVAHRINELALVCLRVTRERDTVRRILQVLQAMCVPPSASRAQIDREGHRHLLLLPCTQYMPEIILYIFQSLDGVLQSALWPTLTDTLYTLLLTCEDNGIKQAAQWTYDVVVSNSAILVKIPNPEREVVFQALLRFAHDRSSRRFKALLTDVGKVCSNELECEALQDYML